MGWWLGSPVQRSDTSSRPHNQIGVSPVSYLAASSNHLFDVEVISLKTGNHPPKQLVRSSPISGWEGER